MKKGGVFVGPLPEGYKPSSRGRTLDQKAVDEHRDADDGLVYDDISMEVNTAIPDSYATFARGKAISLLTKKSLQSMIASGKVFDPLNRQPLHPEVIAWVFENKEGPFFPEVILPISQTEEKEKVVNVVNCEDKYLVVLTQEGMCYIYDRDYALIGSVEVEAGVNQAAISEDDTFMYVVSYTDENASLVSPALHYIRKDTTSTLKEKKPTLLNNPNGEGIPVKNVFFIEGSVFVVFYPHTIYQWKVGGNRTTRISKPVRFDSELTQREGGYSFHYRDGILVVYNRYLGTVSKYRYEEGGFKKVVSEVYLQLQNSSLNPMVSVSGQYLATPSVGSVMRAYDITRDRSPLMDIYKSAVIQNIYNVTSFAVSDRYMVYSYMNVITVVDLAEKREVQKIRVKDAVGERRLERIRVVLFRGRLVVGYDEAMMIFEERE